MHKCNPGDIDDVKRRNQKKLSRGAVLWLFEPNHGAALRAAIEEWKNTAKSNPLISAGIFMILRTILRIILNCQVLSLCSMVTEYLQSKLPEAAILLYYSYYLFIFFSTARYCTACACYKNFPANEKRRQTFLSIAWGSPISQH